MTGEGIEALSVSAPTDFGRTADAVVANLEAAFAEHDRKLTELTSGKWKFAFKDIGSWLVIGSVEVAAAATGMPLYGLAAIAGNQLLDVPKLRELPAGLKSLIDKGRELKKSPVGVLFSYKDG